MSIQSNFISISNRCEIEIRGVKDILSYESDKIILQLEESQLIICGNEFNVKKIDVDNQNALISGHVSSLVYSDDDKKRSGSFLASLFR